MVNISKRKRWLIIGLLALLMLPLSWYSGKAMSDTFVVEQTIEGSEKAVTVDGTIIDHNSREPIKGAKISVEGVGSSTTDENGYYSLDGVPIAPFVLVVEYQGKKHDCRGGSEPENIPGYGTGAPVHFSVDVWLNLKEPEKTPEVVVTAKRPDNPVKVTTGKIYGQLVSSTTGSPLAGARLELKGTSFKTMTDEKGNYFFVNVPPGIYEIGLNFQSGYQTAQKDVKVVVKRSTKVDLSWKTADPSQEVKAANEVVGSKFIAYDEKPMPVGGFSAVQKQLVYPEIARKAGIEGMVVVNVHFGEKGQIIDTKVIESLGNNGCDEAAVAAIKSVKWLPAKQRNKPVAVWVTLPVEFNLR